jgi:NAD(P)-dependent dehydrogenase (short-subunit alcohol dehydrogenase family)
MEDKMSKEPDGPVHVILGATGGIGRALTARLAGKGARLVLGARSEDALGELAEETGALAVPLDARRFEEVDRIAKRALEEHGRLEGLANCVGSVFLKPAHATTEEDLDEVIATNLKSAFAAVRAAAGAMRKTGGSVVLVSTSAARVGMGNHEAIAAAKAGVTGLALAAAATYAPRNIRVNAVAPGLVRTPATARLTASEAAERASASLHALGRIGEPEEVASLIDWLLDPEQSWVTGQEIGVDGGLATVRPPLRVKGAR